MPDTMSVERRQLMKAFGAELVEGAKGMGRTAARRAGEGDPEQLVPGRLSILRTPRRTFDHRP